MARSPYETTLLKVLAVALVGLVEELPDTRIELAGQFLAAGIAWSLP
jgi:hypothetical protein